MPLDLQYNIWIFVPRRPLSIDIVNLHAFDLSNQSIIELSLASIDAEASVVQSEAGKLFLDSTSFFDFVVI